MLLETEKLPWQRRTGRWNSCPRIPGRCSTSTLGFASPTCCCRTRTAAEPHLLAARRLADRLALPQLRYRLNERLGRLRRLQGRHKEAQALLEAAIDEIELSRGTVAQDAMRVSFLRDKTAAYEDLLLVHLAR